MANTIIKEDLLFQLIKKQIEIEVEKAYENAMKQAMEKADIQIKEKLAEISLKLLSHYSVERNGANILITVRNEL